MCGILVVLAKTGRLDLSACRRALSTMHWRGPDFSFARVWEDRLFMGQTVLSITGEPREGAGEYYRSRSLRYELLYNGEIYNFRDLESRFLKPRPELTSRYGTDTEALVNLHEALSPMEVPPLLDGMYAYVLFDTLERQIYISRDIQGEKSLYVYEDPLWVVIASEIRAIRTLIPSISIDVQALRDYFRTRHLMLFERTVYHGIRQLLPGSLETLDMNSLQWSVKQTLRLRDWINPQRLQESSKRSTDALTDELDSLLAKCVREMIPSGRRYASVVSGGIDSSLISTYVVRYGNPDLLVAVNNIGKDTISNDLTRFERTLGRQIQALQVDAQAYAAEIVRCQSVCGGPLHSHSFIPQSQQSALVRASGCRVLFGGEGADELFGGYEAYQRPNKPNGRFSLSPYMAHTPPAVEFIEDRSEPFQNQLAAAWADALNAYWFVEDERDRVALAMMYCDTVHQLSGVGLRGTDFMSMMWSVETRSVYLRRPIMQFALNLPAAMKADRDCTNHPLLRAKPLLKQLFLRYFPRSLLFEKQGFAGFPNESAAFLGDPFDYRAVKILGIHPDSLAAGQADRACMWKLINTEYFLRQIHL